MLARNDDSGKLSSPLARPPIEDYHIAIDSEGVWYHEGNPIRRPELVRLFASVLRREADGSYWLVTPAERGPITVADVPFLAIAVESIEDSAGSALSFTTNVGDTVVAGPGHDIHVTKDTVTGNIRPYIEVRDGLCARLTRAVYYQLAELAVPGPEAAVRGEEEAFGVWSKGNFYPLT